MNLPDPSALRGETPVTVKGWCPGAVRPMAASDGLVVRIRPPAGRLSRAQASAVAALAERYAHPVLELTNRAHLQLRGVAPAQHAPLLDALQRLGLADADAAGEARRNVQVQPLWTDGDITPGLALALGERLAGDGAPALPAKFGFVVDTGPQPCLRGAYADIRLERHGAGVLVHADGADHGVAVPVAQAPACALALADWFLAAGGAPAGRGRMAALLQRQPLPAAWRQTPVAAAPAAPPHPGPQTTGFLAGLAFGLLPAHTLAVLAEHGALRLTPWRALLVEGARHLPALPELVCTADDARLRVAACTGAPGCEQAAGPTRSLARELAALVPPGQRLHVSGCPKGCAHPQPAVTVVTTPGGLDLVRWGTAASQPAFQGVDRPTLTTHLHESFAHAAPL